MSRRWSAAARLAMSAKVRAQWADPVKRAQRLEALARARENTTIKFGRPSLREGDSSRQLTGRVPLGDYDLIEQVAQARKLSIADLLRDWIELGLERDVEHHHFKPSGRYR